MRNHATDLINNGKEYQNLLNYLFSLDFIWNEDIPYPKLKDICAVTGLTSGKLKRLTTLIFKDMITERDKDIKLNVNKVEYVFSLRYFDKRIGFVVDDLPVVPRIGESIRIEHFYHYIGCRYFHVEDITHEIIDTTQSIYFRLKDGHYNKYWHIRKDEADCKREISIHDYHFLDDDEMKKKLGVLPKGW
ncbi:MAG: hypothetical protein HQ521_17785 [Bacteroidetes bacterium]|nr:hypothetical protein [Bacteroidota bacterium]